MPNRDVISIKFGVSGGGSISGESGKLIQQQLGEIVDSINNAASIQKKLAIKFNIDQSYLQKQIQEIANNINIKVKDVKIDTGGLASTTNTTSSHVAKEISDNNKIQKQIDSKIRSYTKLTANIEEWNQRYGKIVSTNQQVHQGLEKVLASARELPKSNIEDLDKQYNDLRFTFDNLRNAASQTGAMTLTMGQKFKKAFESKVFNNLAVVLVGAVGRAFKQVYQNVKQLDAAITDLQVATGKNRDSVKELINDYSKLAKQLGATTLEVAKSADTWLRQGYSIAQANELIINSMMLSKLGQIGSTEAAKALTSAMKGYKVSVEDAMGVVDKFTAVDMIAAVSAGNIATAMAETAASANIAGVSMDKLIGYISTVAEVTQDGAESVGM